MKRHEVIISDDAMRDIEMLYESIAVGLGEPIAAEKILRAVLDKMEMLAMVPKISIVKYRIKGKALRAVRVKKYTIVYYLEGDDGKMTILAVVQSKKKYRKNVAKMRISVI